MSKQTLRELAKDFAKGAIDKDTYRKSRTDLIQGIISGKIAVNEIDYEAPLKPTNDAEEAITEGIQRDKTQVVSPEPKRKSRPDKTAPINQTSVSKKKSPFIFLIVSAIIVLSLIVTVILFYPKPPEPKTVKISTKQSSITSASADVSTINNDSVAGEALIGDFLNESNWNEESLNNFIASWSALSTEEKEAASQTKRMQRMQDSIYKRFLEGKALASIDTEKAKEKQQILIEFANAIGIVDERLVLE